MLFARFVTSRSPNLIKISSVTLTDSLPPVVGLGCVGVVGKSRTNLSPNDRLVREGPIGALEWVSQICKYKDVVVVSQYQNPLQFPYDEWKCGGLNLVWHPQNPTPT